MTAARKVAPASAATGNVAPASAATGNVAPASAATGNVIVLDELSIAGPLGAALLAPTSLTVRAGTVTGLTGPSGCGKTTLLKAILGSVPPQARVGGSLAVAGQPVLTLEPGALQRFRRDRVAFVGQDPASALNPTMRVRALLAELAADPSESALATALERVGLSGDHLRRRPGELSGGQQRRVALARALLRRTDILVLDEPLAGLHGGLRSEIAALLRELAAAGTTVLVSGHDVAALHDMSDDVVALGAAGVGELTKPAAGQAHSDAVLRLRQVRATIGRHTVLHDVDLDLAPGQALALVGPSGAGKTTLARVAAGLHRPASGQVHCGVARAVVPQNPLGTLNPRRTVAQTVARPLRRLSGTAKADTPERVRDLLTAVQLDPEVADRYPAQLSGGQRQRVALARALAGNPAVLICDEITSMLDQATAASIMALLDGLRRDGTTLLVVTHDLQLARRCERICVLDGGRVVEAGTTAAVLDDPQHPATRALVG